MISSTESRGRTGPHGAARWRLAVLPRVRAAPIGRALALGRRLANTPNRRARRGSVCPPSKAERHNAKGGASRLTRPSQGVINFTKRPHLLRTHRVRPSYLNRYGSTLVNGQSANARNCHADGGYGNTWKPLIIWLMSLKLMK